MTSCDSSSSGCCAFWRRIQWLILHICVLGISGVLLGAFWIQFGQGEFPCPLCVLQRMAMILAAIGPLFILLQGRTTRLGGVSIFRAGFGMSIVAAALGACISTRQVLLHIGPTDAGYGSAVMGMHLYTWALVVFMTVILVSGLMLIFGCEPAVSSGLDGDDDDDDEDTPRRRMPWFTALTFWIFVVIIVLNALAVFAEAGFTPFLPDNPDAYLLFGSGE